MNNKCLVTQLKASCTEMKNPIYFGKTEMVVQVLNGSVAVPFIYRGKCVFEVIEGDASNVSVHTGGDYETHVKQLDSKTWMIDRDNEDVYDSGLSSSYNPIRFSMAGTYKIRFSKYSAAPYCTFENCSILLNINDMLYRKEGVRQKYGYTSYQSFNGNLKDLVKFSVVDTNTFSISNQYGGGITTGDLWDILSSLKNLQYLKLSFCSEITGNIEDFDKYENKSNLTHISFWNFQGKITGSIVTAFKGCTSLAELQLENCVGVTGSIEELAQAQVANGRTSGTLKISGNAQQVVPNPIGSGKTITFTNEGYSIS